MGVPQFLLAAAHRLASGSGVQPQMLGVPAPPQVSGAVHEPHDTVRDTPQLSAAETKPQFLPRRAQSSVSLSGVQPQMLGVPPPPQVSGGAHSPQLTGRETPQLSGFGNRPCQLLRVML